MICLVCVCKKRFCFVIFPFRTKSFLLRHIRELASISKKSQILFCNFLLIVFRGLYTNGETFKPLAKFNRLIFKIFLHFLCIRYIFIIFPATRFVKICFSLFLTKFTRCRFWNKKKIRKLFQVIG